MLSLQGAAPRACCPGGLLGSVAQGHRQPGKHGDLLTPEQEPQFRGLNS